MRFSLVCGAGGFIGHHLVRALKARGEYVRGVDLREPEFCPHDADDWRCLDLRDPSACRDALAGCPDRVYQLAADMGGMGFISSHEVEVLHNNALINLNVLRAASRERVGTYFFSSSVCVYPDMPLGAQQVAEEAAYPARPDNEYGWEKLYAERTALAYARRGNMQVRIARFQNIYGPEGTWRGGREKAPAAICRKVAEAADEIEIWGNGTAVRNYTYIADLIAGVLRLADSGETRPTNIGSDEYVDVKTLARTVMEVAGKSLKITSVPGPIGVWSRNFSNARIKALGWRPRTDLRAGIARTYPWILEQVRRADRPPG